MIVEKLLFFGLNIDLRNSDGLILLMIVVVNGKLNVFSFLVERGLDLILKN